MPTRTAILEAKIHNQRRKMLRAMESGDVKRLLRMKAVVLPRLEDAVENHNAVVMQIGVAKAQAEALKMFIDRPHPVFRKSYALEFWIENFLTC